MGKVAGYMWAVVVLLFSWHFCSVLLGIPALPPPWPTLAAFGKYFFPSIAPHLMMSTVRVVVSLSFGLLTAVPAGLFLGQSEKMDRLFAPLIYLLYPIPKVVFLPVVFVLAGIGDRAKIFLICLIVFFHILMTTRDASRGISRQSVYSMLSLGARPVQVYRHVIFPACLPKILTAARVSLGTAIAVLFFSETVAGNSGLGYFILDSWYRAEYSQMFAGILGMSLLGLMLYVFLDILEHRWCQWQHL